MADLGTIDIFIHGANIVALGGAFLGLLKVVIPASLAIRDSFRDTAAMLSILKDQMKDHEDRIRHIEQYVGPERRRVERL